jgi:hypothetical protein
MSKFAKDWSSIWPMTGEGQTDYLASIGADEDVPWPPEKMNQDEFHKGWELLFRDNSKAIGTMLHRMRVPGGWIYKDTVILRRRWLWRRSKLVVSLAFVPDPNSN